MEELILKNAKVVLDNGELVSYKVDGHEFIHQKGSPGWRNSDTEMFPIIGPTSEAHFQVQTPRGKAIQDQHGLLRELQYDLISNNEVSALYQKQYRANTKVVNSKYPSKSPAEELSWPYDFNFKKGFSLSEKGLEVSFKILGEEGLPFMLGYHPAFKLHIGNPSIETGNRNISLTEVLTVGSRALQIADCEKILLRDKKNLSIKTEGFGNFMLWTEVPNMICIEPITFYPYAVTAGNLHNGFELLNTESIGFKVYLNPE